MNEEMNEELFDGIIEPPPPFDEDQFLKDTSSDLDVAGDLVSRNVLYSEEDPNNVKQKPIDLANGRKYNSDGGYENFTNEDSFDDTISTLSYSSVDEYSSGMTDLESTDKAADIFPFDDPSVNQSNDNSDDKNLEYDAIHNDPSLFFPKNKSAAYDEYYHGLFVGNHSEETEERNLNPLENPIDDYGRNQTRPNPNQAFENGLSFQELKYGQSMLFSSQNDTNCNDKDAFASVTEIYASRMKNGKNGVRFDPARESPVTNRRFDSQKPPPLLPPPINSSRPRSSAYGISMNMNSENSRTEAVLSGNKRKRNFESEKEKEDIFKQHPNKKMKLSEDVKNADDSKDPRKLGLLSDNNICSNNYANLIVSPNRIPEKKIKRTEKTNNGRNRRRRSRCKKTVSKTDFYSSTTYERDYFLKIKKKRGELDMELAEGENSPNGIKMVSAITNRVLVEDKTEKVLEKSKSRFIRNCSSDYHTKCLRFKSQEFQAKERVNCKKFFRLRFFYDRRFFHQTRWFKLYAKRNGNEMGYFKNSL